MEERDFNNRQRILTIQNIKLNYLFISGLNKSKRS
jgi:hypothetical protein